MERQFLKACETGNLPNVKELCRVVDASKVRDTSWSHSSPLHWAARYVKHGPILKLNLVYNDNILHRKKPKFYNDFTQYLCYVDSHNYVVRAMVTYYIQCHIKMVSVHMNL